MNQIVEKWACEFEPDSNLAVIKPIIFILIYFEHFQHSKNFISVVIFNYLGFP